MENIKVDVIIPAYHPGKEFSTLIERLTKQTFPIHRIIVMNTEETYWNKFMASGKVDDYLEYKGIQICHSVMEHYADHQMPGQR